MRTITINIALNNSGDAYHNNKYRTCYWRGILIFLFNIFLCVRKTHFLSSYFWSSPKIKIIISIMSVRKIFFKLHFRKIVCLPREFEKKPYLCWRMMIYSRVYPWHEWLAYPIKLYTRMVWANCKNNLTLSSNLGHLDGSRKNSQWQ